MKAALLYKPGSFNDASAPLVMEDIAIPECGPEDVLIRVTCCGICHTELDQIEGRVRSKAYPVVPGHQVTGVITGFGTNVKSFRKGDRAGLAWINSACGNCDYCLAGLENLCPDFRATGLDAN